MTVFHQIEKSFRNDCGPPNLKNDYALLCSTIFRNDCAPQHLEMTVFHQIEKQFRNDWVPPN